MARVGSIVPVVPVPLIASVFLGDETKKFSELELKSAVEQLIEKLEAGGAHVYIPRKDLDYAVTVGLRMLTLRRLVNGRLRHGAVSGHGQAIEFVALRAA